jgi:hypothetical protein
LIAHAAAIEGRQMPVNAAAKPAGSPRDFGC